MCQHQLPGEGLGWAIVVHQYTEQACQEHQRHPLHCSCCFPISERYPLRFDSNYHSAAHRVVPADIIASLDAADCRFSPGTWWLRPRHTTNTTSHLSLHATDAGALV